MRDLSGTIRKLAAALALSLGLAGPVRAQSNPAPAHHAGEIVDRGANFTIHKQSIMPIRPNEYCSGGRYPTLSLKVVFDVPDDFELTEAYLETYLPYERLRTIADKICPDATIITTSHYFKDRFLDHNKRISDYRTVSTTRREMPFSSLNYSQDAGNTPQYTNRLRLKGRSWNAVEAYDNAGGKTEDQVGFAQQQAADRAALQAKSDAIAKVRRDYFEARKAELNWPSGDNWMFDAYMAGRQSGPPPPPRSPEWHQKLKFDYPTRDGMLLAYVERAQKTCGAASPNGTVMIGFTLTDSSSGQQMDSQSFPVDVQLRDAYEAAKLSTGAYNAISLSLIKAYQDDLEPLFARWQCDGPEFDRFIDGILNTPD